MKTKSVKQIIPLICAAALLITCCVGAIGLAASVYRSHVSARAAPPDVPFTADEFALGENIAAYAEYSYSNGDTPANISYPNNATRINSSTKIIFEYHYLDGAVARIEEATQPFMLGMTLSSIQEAFSEWIVSDFDENKLVMQRFVDKIPTNHYIVGVYDGYVAVFYGFGVNNGSLMNVTRTPVSILPYDEVLRLGNGIHIIGTDKLFQVLQDYGS